MYFKGHTVTNIFTKTRFLVLLAIVWNTAWAQAPSFPNKPIRWVIVAPAGSSLDVIARAMQDKLKDNLGQAVVVENKPQAGGTVGTNEVAKSAPDGYTWVDRKSTRLNSSHIPLSRMPSSA